MLNYVRGDATDPRGGRGIIAHVCNDQGGWGGRGGFVKSLSKRWTLPEERYRKWAADGFEENTGPFKLGNTQFVTWPDGPLSGNVWVANMLAQKGYTKPGYVALQYDHLEHCLLEVMYEANRGKLHVQMPRIGTGLGGGTWDRIAPLILKAMDEFNVDVYVYDP